MTAEQKEHRQQRILQALRNARERKSDATFTGDDCGLLLEYIDESYNRGWKQGEESAQADTEGEGW